MDTRHIKMTIFVQKSPASSCELSQKMLLSTRIVFQFAARTALARDCNVPDDESGRQGSLVPRLLPAFQCCTLNSKRAGYLIARDCHATVQSMGHGKGRK